MANILDVEFLENSARVHYKLGKPDGVEDVYDARVDIPYDPAHRILRLPQKRLLHPDFWHCEEVHIAQRGQTVVFVFDSHQERSMGPNEEDMHGPYLKREEGTVECFWWTNELRGKKTNLAHLVREATEADEYGRLYSSYCGEETFSSESAREDGPGPQFGTLLDAIGMPINICGKCNELAVSRIIYARRMGWMVGEGHTEEIERLRHSEGIRLAELAVSGIGARGLVSLLERHNEVWEFPDEKGEPKTLYLPSDYVLVPDHANAYRRMTPGMDNTELFQNDRDFLTEHYGGTFVAYHNNGIVSILIGQGRDSDLLYKRALELYRPDPAKDKLTIFRVPRKDESDHCANIFVKEFPQPEIQTQ